MSVCWASGLGDCSEKISREHLVSQSLFMSEEITVQGFPWCKDTPKKVGLQNLTAKILCRKHNSDLSPIDEAGAAAFDAIRQAKRLGNIRQRLRTTYWHVEKFKIDGPALERWFVKTLVNVAFGREHRIGSDSTVAGEPSMRLVEIAFGKNKSDGRAGIYQVVHVGQQIQSDDTVSFSPLIKDNSYIAGGLFSFRGLRFLLFLGSEGLNALPHAIGLPGEDWGISQLNYHNEEMKAMINGRLSHVIRVKW
jgi:hypothetical protein